MTSGMAADGEIAWSWRPDAGAKSRRNLFLQGDGGKKARSPGRSRISRNTIAQGRPDDPPVPVVLPRAFLLHADHGCGGTRPSLRPPSFRRGKLDARSGRLAPRQRRGVSAEDVNARTYSLSLWLFENLNRTRGNIWSMALTFFGSLSPCEEGPGVGVHLREGGHKKAPGEAGASRLPGDRTLDQYFAMIGPPKR
jgi:hypothetical protein